MLEAAAAVLVGPARRLNDSVEGQADEGNNVHMRVLLVWSCRRLLILYTNDLRDIDTDSAVGVGGRSSATTAPARCAVQKSDRHATNSQTVGHQQLLPQACPGTRGPSIGACRLTLLGKH